MNPKLINLMVRAVTIFILLTLLSGSIFENALTAYAAPGDLARVSVDSSGAQANGGSARSQLSGDGRYVVFESDAANLAAGDTNNALDVFLHDRQTRITTRVSLASQSGAQANADSGSPAISNDGRYVTFESNATNLVAVDANGQSDIFLRDLQTGITTLVSVDSSGVQANDISENSSISDDGRFVAFTSTATNLVSGDVNEARDVFVRDIQSGVTMLASVSSSGVRANASSLSPQISDNGRYVVFVSVATNLVDGDTNGQMDIFVRDLQTGETTRVSVNSNGEQGDRLARDPSISADGRFVSFSSYSNNLKTEDTYGWEYLYVRDRQAGTTTLESVYTDGYTMYGWSEESVISADGRYIVFMFDEKGDSMPDRWAYVRDRITGVALRVTPAGAIRPTISADGRFVAYQSVGALVPEDTNGESDIFLKEVAYPPDLIPTVAAVMNNCPYGCSGPADQVVNFTVTFSETVTGVDTSDFALTVSSGISGAAITGVHGSHGEYFVSVNTGTGDGTLRLDVLDDDTIRDFTQNPLGGAGAGNGSFTGGEIYIVDKVPPAVISITRADFSPTMNSSVNFLAAFSEDVSGVDASDFVLTSTGNILGAGISEISGSGKNYTIKVNTGAGDGTLRLDLLDDDSIRDIVSRPLGGDGAGNGAYSAGDIYQIDKSIPAVISILRADANPTAAENIRFVVTFSEAVSGVDAGDFILTTTENLSGAYIINVEGSVNIYTVTVAAGGSNGTLRLDLMDNDSVVDSVNQPLGGVGANNGNFNNAEIYVIDKIFPTVTGILLVDPNPTGADSIHFTVNFSEAVIGVDAGDFSLFASGTISGATVVNVSGSGSSYAVTATTGKGDGTLRLDLLDNDSILDAVNNPLGGAGADNGAYNAGGTYAADKSTPMVISILRTDPNPASADTVNFKVIFSEAVGGVDAGDFTLFTTSGITGAAVTLVGSGDSPGAYLVTANTGSGNGDLRLDVIDDDSIVDPVAHPLGGAGAGNGIFTGGETYTVAKVVPPLVENFVSTGVNDGWVLESTETSEQGGEKNSTALTFNLGDNALNRQYRAILHFPTASIPDNAVVTSVTLRIKRQGLVGTDPFITHQNILVDVRSGAFGLPDFLNPNLLHETDFYAASSRDAAGVIQNNPLDGWYWTQLDAAANPYINLAGVTQFRLRFQVDDNNDRDNDYMKFYSGDDGIYLPQLRVEYYVPGETTPPTYEGYTIEYLRSRTYGGGTLDMIRKVSQEKDFTTYLAKYASDGLPIYALVNLPNNVNPHPVIITLHGYYPPQSYDLFQQSDNGVMNSRLARQGFITIYPAMRNYPPSASGDNLFRVGQSIDVLNLIAIIKAQGGKPGLLENADAQHIGLEGTSTGGGVALRALTVSPDVKAAVLYASISGDEKRNVPFFQVFARDDPQFAGEAAAPANTLSKISPASYYSLITAPILLAHGSEDKIIPADWGRETCDLLKTATKTVTCSFYQSAGHLFTGTTLDTFISRTIEFYRKYLYVIQPPPPVPTNIQWSEVSFNDLAPRGAEMKQCWNSMGMDDQGRVYIGFTSKRADKREDFLVFRYDPASRERIFLGTFLDVTAAAGNAQPGENIPKGHTRMIYANGKMYMGSQNFHDLKWEIDSLPTYRGSHLFSFDTALSLWKDLSAALPGGVVTAHEGIISLNVLPEEHMLIGLAHPSSNIVLYDYQAEQLVKVVPGIPWTLGNPLSREVIVAPSGNIYTYRGTEEVNQLGETHSVWVYNIHTGEMKDTGFQMTKGFWVGQTKKRDGSKIYVSTVGGELYEFNTATETFKDLGYELPKTDNRTIDYTYALTLSPDETKIFYAPSIIRKAGVVAGTGKIGSGLGSGELYYYDLATGQVVFVKQLPFGVYTSADLRDSQNIYFSHFGSNLNVWSDNPSLFVLSVPSTP